MYHDLSMHHEWPVKKAIVDIPKGIRLKGNLKHTSSNSLSPLGAQKRDLRATSQTLLINNLFLLKLKWAMRSIAHEGERNSCSSKIQLVGQNIDKKQL